MTDSSSRMRVHGCDFLLSRRKKGPGWNVYVRKALDGERTFLETKRSARDAESFALSWAHREQALTSRGAPSQLVKPRTPRIQLEEE